MPTEPQKARFLTILEKCREKRVNNCPQNELPEFLGVSLSTIKQFEKGKVFDWWLLNDYAEFLGYKIYTDLIDKPIT